MKTMITGGAGFIAVNIAEELAGSGLDLVLVDINDFPQEIKAVLEGKKGSVSYCQADICDGRRLDEIIWVHKVDRIIHAAVITPGPEREKKQSRLIAQVNFMGTVEVLEAARRNGIEKLVYLSSASVYGDAVDGLDIISEAHTFPRPVELYAITKFAAERTALRYRELFGMNIIVGRIGGVFGPWERWSGFRDTMSGQFLANRAALLGQDIELANAEVKDWVYSRDIAGAVLALLLAQNPSFEVYHLSSGYIWTVKDWCKKLQETYPNFTYQVQADPGVVERPPLEINRLIEDLGYVPKFDLQSSFDDYLNWIRQTSDFWIGRHL